jgi:hypothetical protein
VKCLALLDYISVINGHYGVTTVEFVVPLSIADAKLTALRLTLERAEVRAVTTGSEATDFLHQGFESPPIRSSFILLLLVLVLVLVIVIVIVIAASAQIAPAHCLQILPQLYDVCARDHAANVCPGINDAISADDGTGIKHGIATDLGPVANNGAEFGQSGRDGVVGSNDRNFAMIEFYIR